MPLFMDRHYMKNATRRAIELAHLEDLKIQEKFGVRFITYWFDEARHTTFCLVEAPDVETIRHVHAEAHGDIPHEIINVDAGAVESFLGRLADPMPETEDEGVTPEVDSAFRVIMFTDLKDSTAMTSQLGDSDAMHLLRIHNALARNAIRDNDGREIKHTGDGFMISFTSSDAALACAVAMQEAFAEHRQAHPGDTLHLRIGISSGEPVEEGNDLFGLAVQIAARLCNAASPDSVLVAETVLESCNCAGNFDVEPIREHKLKGIEQSVAAAELHWAQGAA